MLVGAGFTPWGIAGPAALTGAVGASLGALAGLLLTRVHAVGVMLPAWARWGHWGVGSSGTGLGGGTILLGVALAMVAGAVVAGWAARPSAREVEELALVF